MSMNANTSSVMPFNGTNYVVNGDGTISEANGNAVQGWKFGMEFPGPDEVLDKLDAFNRAREVLGEDGMQPPDAIRVLAEQRAAELDVEVGFQRVAKDDRLEWEVNVKTKRGIASASPSLTEKQQRELERDFLPIEAWKNAMREVGLL